MKISMISIIGKNRELGKDGHLLFHIKDDMKRFRDITRGHAIIMGRKTFESKEIGGKPLPNKTNIVITRDESYMVEGTIVVNSLEEAIGKAKEIERQGEAFIIGGGQIYEQALPYSDKLYLTIVDKTVEADTFFPDYSEFKKLVFSEKHMDDGLEYEFTDLERDIK